MALRLTSPGAIWTSHARSLVTQATRRVPSRNIVCGSSFCAVELGNLPPSTAYRDTRSLHKNSGMPLAAAPHARRRLHVTGAASHGAVDGEDGKDAAGDSIRTVSVFPGHG